MRAPVVVFGLLALILGAYAAIPDQDWGYVDVRPNAHMFWYDSHLRRQFHHNYYVVQCQVMRQTIGLFVMLALFFCSDFLLLCTADQ
jgi:hypothetical protein